MHIDVDIHVMILSALSLSHSINFSLFPLGPDHPRSHHRSTLTKLVVMDPVGKGHTGFFRRALSAALNFLNFFGKSYF